MQAFLSSLGRAITSAVLLVAGAIFAFSLLVAGLIAALLLGVAALLSGGRIKARRFRMPQRPGTRAPGRGEVVDVEVREVADPPPPIDR
jgi:riboflavin biosynthesis pyrimidine reductase